MYVVILAGGIASGKSSVAERLASLGAVRIDLDVLSRQVTSTGSSALSEIASAFGKDVIDESGALRRPVLAERAFATPEKTRLLESIVHPHIRLLLKERLAALEEEGFSSVVVVEVPLLDRVEDLIAEVDEVLVVTCPVGVRRVRAIGRGMDGRDFDARVGKQPTDAWLVARADTVFDNRGTRQELIDEVDAWFYARTAQLGGASAPEGI
jgi:dephospho-CoA kinase